MLDSGCDGFVVGFCGLLLGLDGDGCVRGCLCIGINLGLHCCAFGGKRLGTGFGCCGGGCWRGGWVRHDRWGWHGLARHRYDRRCGLRYGRRFWH